MPQIENSTATTNTMKIVPLGNFHDTKKLNLPTFYRDYVEPTKADFERLLGSPGEETPTGQNTIIKIGTDGYHLYINSVSHIVMTNVNGNYHFQGLYNSRPEHSAQKVETGEDSFTQQFLTEIKGKEGKIKGVFSKGFSSCGFQVAFLGNTKENPQYIVFSHLQNTSRLASIAAQLKVEQKSIHGIFSIMYPHTNSCEYAHQGLANVNEKSVILIRDANLWTKDSGCVGFGMNICGCLLETNKLQLLMTPVYSNLFIGSSTAQISSLPIYKSTPEPMCQQIRQFKASTPNATLVCAPAPIQNYYFDLFMEGSFGDKSFVGFLAPRNDTAAWELIKKNFIRNYNSLNIQEFIGFIKKSPLFNVELLKPRYIQWQFAQTPAEIIKSIEEFEAPSFDSIFKDMTIVK